MKGRAGGFLITLIAKHIRFAVNRFDIWAWVAKVTGMLRLGGWPEGMLVIICRKRRHPVPAAGHSHRRARVYLFGTERLAVHRPDGRAPSSRAVRGQHPVRPGKPACATSHRTDTTKTHQIESRSRGGLPVSSP